MPRAPYNVLVLPYKQTGTETDYCIFKRRDNAAWQFIAGGGEESETPIEAAKRESGEEGEIYSAEMTPLKTMTYVPANVFSEKAQKTWGSDTIVIPVYTFVAKLPSDSQIVISKEHTEYRWCKHDEAISLLFYDVDKTALHEIKELLKRKS